MAPHAPPFPPSTSSHAPTCPLTAAPSAQALTFTPAFLFINCKLHVQGILMPSLLCCESGMVDKCGVCDGDGTSCPTISTVYFKPLTSMPTGRRLTGTGTHLKAGSIVPAVARGSTSHARPLVFSASAGITRQFALREGSGGLAYGSRRLHDASLNEAIERFKACMCTSLLRWWVQKVSNNCTVF
jgi:hypothetical protein